jgi:chaperonin cofactor prefoldin
MSFAQKENSLDIHFCESIMAIIDKVEKNIKEIKDIKKQMSDLKEEMQQMKQEINKS